MKLPDCPFYLFGMGLRRKLLYRAGTLSEALTGAAVRKWDVASETIRPSDYTVVLETADGNQTVIAEDQEGVWVREDGGDTMLTEGPLKLPRFEEHPHASILRALHHEIVTSIVDGRPVPNLFVYPRPWHRDAAMVCMCLARTGNLHVVRDWILSLREPFDRNNKGTREPDNLGQTLYMASLVGDSSHPVVEATLNATRSFRRRRHIAGLTDYAPHPVYQTKWLKFGLHALGLDDPYAIPYLHDSYSCLFWMANKEAHVDGPPFSEETKDLYPYLGWAEAHFHGWRLEPGPAEAGRPLTWEAQASEPDYAGMARICPEYVDRKICAPHSWHAAEMFLYLLDSGAAPGKGG